MDDNGNIQSRLSARWERVLLTTPQFYAMTPIRRPSRLLQQPLGKALTASLAFHLVGCCLLAALGVVPLPQQPHFRGDAATTTIVLRVEASQPLIEMPLVEMTADGQPILITPSRAHVAQRTFLDTASAEVTLQEMLAQEELQVLQAESMWEKLHREPPAVERPPLVVPPQALTRPLVSPDDSESALQQPPEKHSQSFSTSRATPPDFSGNRPPHYPARDLQLRHQGVVLLRLSVDRTGRVIEVRLIRSSGHATLDAAAASAVRTWQGEPARRDGEPVATTWDLPVRFRLGN